MDISIRDARPADARDIVTIIRESAAEDQEHSPVTEAYVADYLASPGSWILIADAEGRAAGLLSYSIRPGLFHAAPSCLIELLIVRRDVRGRGAGSALMKALLSRTAALGCAEVSVSTMPDDAGALRFYRRHGLSEACVFLERHNFEGQPPAGN
ncbi:MAG: GNAT family N-acetyltransferase [Anaerolineales bacterium]|nr:GNAT family N-acetyltransferase [Anaerolineales bacterium]